MVGIAELPICALLLTEVGIIVTEGLYRGLRAGGHTGAVGLGVCVEASGARIAGGNTDPFGSHVGPQGRSRGTLQHAESGCPIGIAGVALFLAHPRGVLPDFVVRGVAAGEAGVGVVVCEGAFQAVHWVFGAVEVVGVQPLFVLADTHAGAVAVGLGNLLVVAVGALIRAEVRVRVCEGRGRTELDAGSGDVVPEGTTAGLHAFVVETQRLCEVA